MRRMSGRKVSQALLGASSALALVAAAAAPSAAVLYADTNGDGVPESLSELRFTCELTRHGWMMMGRNDRTEFTPMVQFSEQAAISAEERCLRVTGKFNEVNDLPVPYYLKTDTVFTVDALPAEPVVTEESVICAVMNNGVPCAGDGSFILLTLDRELVSTTASRERILGRILDHISYLKNPRNLVLPVERPPIVSN